MNAFLRSNGINLISRPRVWLCLAAPLFLSGCSGLIDLPSSEDAPQIYQLTAPSEFESNFEKSGWRILVDEPDAARAIDTDRITLRPSEVELSYYAKAKWADRAPRMIQTLVIQSLENSGGVEFAGRDLSGMNSQVLLNGTLDAFHADYSAGKPVVTISLKLNLIDQRTGKILGSEVFSSQTQSDRDQVRSVVLAFNESTQDVLQQAVAWIVSSLGRS